MRTWKRLVCLLILLPGLIQSGYCLWQIFLNFQGESLLEKYSISPTELASPVSSVVSDANLTYSISEVKDSELVIERIPRILHQTYKSSTIPQAWLNAQASCRNLHQSNWEYMFWTDGEAQDFLARHYPWFLPSYLSYPYNIQRADAIRYFVLHHFGGIYLDLDVGCKKDLSPLLTFDAIFPKTEPLGVSNDVMAAVKNHSFIEDLILSLPQSNRIWGTKYATVFFSTGPMFLNRRLLKYLRQARGHHGITDQVTAATGISVHPVRAVSVRILSPELYGSTLTSFFTHYPGSSWHGNDALAVRFVVRNKYSVVVGLSALSCCLYLIRLRLRGSATEVPHLRSSPA